MVETEDVERVADYRTARARCARGHLGLVDCLRVPRSRAELELCPATFADKDDSAELVRAIDEVGEGIKGLGAKGAPGRCYVTTATAAARVS